jgi:hypothetical protein
VRCQLIEAIHQEIAVIRQVLKAAVRHNWLTVMPDLSDPFRKQTKISHRAWFSPEEYKTLYKATRERADSPRRVRYGWESEQLHDFDKLLKAGQTTQAEPLIRQYLEFSLQAIIRKVNIPVPIDFAIKDTSQMAQNCLDAITDAIKLHKAASSLVLDPKQVTDLETVHVPAILGNWVSHYATGSTASFTAPLLQKVVQTIDDLAECFQYDDTSSAVVQRKWYRSLSRR